MVFQNYALYPHMTVATTWASAAADAQDAKKARSRRGSRRSRGILGIDDLLERKPGQLSGGQRQRVAMGRAIVREPQAFLMDEPLSNLDAKLRVQMRAEISRIQQDLGVTTIYVTHDQVEAMTMGDRIAVMRKGVLQQVDRRRSSTTPRQPLRRHVHRQPGDEPRGDTRSNSREIARLRDRPAELEVADHARFDLARSSGRRLALGIRPEALEDAAIAGDGAQTLEGQVVLTEPLGSERLAHIEVEAAPVVTEEVAEAAEDAAEVLREGLEDSRRTVVVGRFDAGSRVAAGERVRFAVDTKKLHLFDLETGLALR